MAIQTENALTIPEILQALGALRELTDAQVRWIITEMIAGRSGEAEAAAVLIALRMKGESAGEIAAAAGVLREHMLRWDAGRDDILDTCGTGGDGAGTFNISTATALVVAAAGVPVVKHGNRSVSSRSGSADVLAALGVRIDGDAEFARRCLREANFAFCFAPQFHPALKQIAALRRRLGVPTIFNCLGPLANPAGAKRQLLGVGRGDLLDRMAQALARLGTENALVLCGQDGLDEVTLSGPTSVRRVCGQDVLADEWTPDDFGLKSCTLAEISAPHAEASATMIKEVLDGATNGAARIVLANAAAALLAAEKVGDVREGVERAREAIRSGQARQVLATLARLSST
ncbi:MAG: anthranilate phosphoribosyltransferase [Planctomycetes bacterium]|nr:anthranilate phosphoribosyltransferase [Planctomycetota bacterium]